jgi:hypothetical protein
VIVEVINMMINNYHSSDYNTDSCEGSNYDDIIDNDRVIAVVKTKTDDGA